MKAIVKLHDGKDGWAIVDQPRRDPADDEIEMKIMASGICGSDLHLYHDNHPYEPGTVIGHEFSGVISRVGKHVTKWKVGDRVVTENRFTGCGACEYCRTGKMAMCKELKLVGYRYDGGWRNYMCLPTKQLIRIPDNVSLDEAAMTEPAAGICEAMCVKAPIHAGETVVVQGCGQMGLIACMVAKAVGAAQVIMTGTTPDEKDRVAVAYQVGADRFINVEKEDVVSVVNELTNGQGADYVMDCSGAPAAIRSAFDIVRCRGRIVAFGEAPGKFEIDWNKGIFKDITLFFSFGSDYRAWRLALGFMERGQLNVKPLITHDISMADFKSGLELLEARECIKVMMHPIEEGY